jgi:uncharacterized protein with PQ loop repeat
MIGNILAWIFMSMSSTIWLFVFIPQIMEIVKIKSVKAISFYLILCWLIGDVLSIETAINLSVNSLIVYTGYFQITFDILFIVLWLKYKCVEEQDHIVNLLETWIFTGTLGGLMIMNVLLDFADERIFALIISWISATSYIIARIPQIILNRRNKSVNGLSLLSFILILIANVFYLLSIVIRLIDEVNGEYIINSLSWVIGTGISIVLNCIILYQFRLYGNNRIQYVEI